MRFTETDGTVSRSGAAAPHRQQNASMRRCADPTICRAASRPQSRPALPGAASSAEAAASAAAETAAEAAAAGEVAARARDGGLARGETPRNRDAQCVIPDENAPMTGGQPADCCQQ